MRMEPSWWDLYSYSERSLSKLWEIVKDWEAWHAVVQDITETHTTEQLNNSIMKKNSSK